MPEGEPKKIENMTHSEAIAKLDQLQDFFGAEKLDELYRRGLADWVEGKRGTIEAFMYEEVDRLDRRALETRDVSGETVAPAMGRLAILEAS